MGGRFSEILASAYSLTEGADWWGAEEVAKEQKDWREMRGNKVEPCLGGTQKGVWAGKPGSLKPKGVDLRPTPKKKKRKKKIVFYSIRVCHYSFITKQNSG